MFRRLTLFFVLGALAGNCSAIRAEDKFFNSNGVKIRYVVQGQGEPVLLIHGFAANIEMQWGLTGIMPALAVKHQVIAFDNRGHGKSGKPHEDKKYGMEMVEDGIRLLDHLKIKKAHVVGYSMGAMLTNKLIITHPQRFISATLGGAAGLRKGTHVKLFEVLADSLDRDQDVGPLVVALTPPNRPKPTPQQIQVINNFVKATNDTKALAAVVRSWKQLSISDEDLKANRVPTLAIVGAQDPLKKRVEEIQGKLGALEKTVIINGADHIIAPARMEFIKELKEFLKKHQQK